MRHALAAAALVLSAGCTLVDQRTFQPTATAPGAAEIARARAPALPLVTIRMDQEYRAALAEAVQAAQQRKPDVTFDIQALVPLQAPPAEQDRRIAEASQDAQAVATAIGAAGISNDRLRLGLLGDAGSPAREVRVYVR